VLPPTVLMFAVAAALEQFQQENWLQGFVKGMSPAIAALIIMVAWDLFHVGQTKKIDRRALFIAGISAISLWLEIPSPLVLLGAGVLGVFLFR
jgi:chromate transport protein ChrA